MGGAGESKEQGWLNLPSRRTTTNASHLESLTLPVVFFYPTCLLRRQAIEIRPSKLAHVLHTRPNSVFQNTITVVRISRIPDYMTEHSIIYIICFTLFDYSVTNVFCTLFTFGKPFPDAPYSDILYPNSYTIKAASNSKKRSSSKACDIWREIEENASSLKTGGLHKKRKQNKILFITLLHFFKRK